MQSCHPALSLSLFLPLTNAAADDYALLNYPHMMILVEYVTTWIHSFQ